MKLFITNKSYMDQDLEELAPVAHQLAYRELASCVNGKTSVPIQLFISDNSYNYLFKLISVDMQKALFVYEYFDMVRG